MLEIILIRHASPLLNTTYCSAKQAQFYLEQYNSTDKLALVELSRFKATAQYQNILNIKRILVSPQVRAQITAKHLFPLRPLITINDLREFDLQIIPIPQLKFSFHGWLVISRILWFLGINKAQKTFSEEKRRIQNLIPTLLTENTVIVTHGFVIREIKKTLKQKNFVNTFSEKQGCFSVDVFNYSE